MKREHSAGAIIFRIENKRPVYLLLHYPSSANTKREYWDLPKGHMEKGEEEKDTARREIQEETGLSDIEFLDGFRQEIRYWFQMEKQKVFKTVVFYLAKTSQEHVVISSEHLDFQWLAFQQAQEKLTYKNAKQILEKANNYLTLSAIF